MMCELCNLNIAVIHLDETRNSVRKRLHLCKACVKKRSDLGWDTMLSYAEGHTEGLFAAYGRVTDVGEGTVTILVERGSNVRIGQSLTLRSRCVPKKLRVVGAEVDFCCPVAMKAGITIQ